MVECRQKGGGVKVIVTGRWWDVGKKGKGESYSDGTVVGCREERGVVKVIVTRRWWDVGKKGEG